MARRIARTLRRKQDFTCPNYITSQAIYPDGGRLALNYTVPVKG